MARTKLSDTFIRSRKAAKPGKRDETMDTEHPRLGLRVTDKVGTDGKPHKSFFFLARLPARGKDRKDPRRLSLGTYPEMTLAEAREKARVWSGLIAKGVDPRDEEKRVAAEAERAKRKLAENAFGLKAEEWLNLEHIKSQRQYGNTARWLRKELVPIWRGTPLGEIHPEDVRAVISAVAKRSPSSARNVLVVCKSFFSWAAGDDSPAAALRPTTLVGKKPRRKRLLNSDEIKALWDATGTLGYPWQPLYRLLLLTGVRLREAAEARWSEIDIDAGRWVIPAERFKSDTPHFVPLAPAVVEMLRALPRFTKGDYVFTASDGERPVSGFGRIKDRIDALMGTDKPWVVHDLRRVVRTGLASLHVSDIVAERVLGHGHSDELKRTYDLYTYEDEMRAALEQWAGRVRDITKPPPANVRKLKRAS
jgi:integrase